MDRRYAALVLAFLLPGCSTASPPADQVEATPVQERMFRHFALARDLRTFAVAGDLERLSVTAGALADEEEIEELPPGSDAYLQELRTAAGEAADATTLSDATFAVARVAATCGSCHLANDSELGSRFQTAQPYLDDPDVRHQNRLSWASRLLWNGLVGPSERTWTTGAGALAGEDGFPEPAASHIPASENAAASRTLREIGVQAVTADDLKTRVDLLARVWETCADCHTQAGIR